VRVCVGEGELAKTTGSLNALLRRLRQGSVSSSDSPVFTQAGVRGLASYTHLPRVFLAFKLRDVSAGPQRSMKEAGGQGKESSSRSSTTG